jgi:hypothetical protein
MEDRPVNFGLVVPGVYRSSYPKADDYGFIKGLKLKTVVYVLTLSLSLYSQFPKLTMT